MWGSKSKIEFVWKIIFLVGGPDDLQTAETGIYDLLNKFFKRTATLSNYNYQMFF